MRELSCFAKRTLTGLSASIAALILSACTTVPVEPPRPTGPIIERPVDPQPSTPTGTEPEIPAEEIVETPIHESPEPPVTEAPYVYDRDGLTPPHMRGREVKRLALLLPFSTNRTRLREEANAMFQAAELAVFERAEADVVLIALDTKGTQDGARSAARAALAQGADVILGPIIGSNSRAAASEARRSSTPVISFSNDQRAAGNGTYLLSFPPEMEVERVVRHAASQGVTRFAYLGPDDAYGRRVRAAYAAAVQRVGGQITASETYQGNDIGVMQAPAQRLAEYYRAEELKARENGGLTPSAFEAIMLPEGGTALRSLAPLLPFNGVDPARVQFLGTSRWNDEEIVREPALGNGIFATADKDASSSFAESYERAYGEAPSALSTLAFDAVAIGAYVATGDPKDRAQRLEAPDGFYGADGFLRFGPDGRPERGLAVYRIQNGSFRLEDPAPRGVTPEG